MSCMLMHAYFFISFIDCLLYFCVCFMLGVVIEGRNRFVSDQEDINKVRIFLIHAWKCFSFNWFLIAFDFESESKLN